MRTMSNSPTWMRWTAITCGWLLALPWYVLACTYRLSLRVKVQGQEHLGGNEARIIAFWHCNLAIWFHVFLRARTQQVWMQHPALFMTPIHAMLRLMGIRKLAFGSTGNDGKAAMTEIIGLLRTGYSTVITPDGPRGPVKRVKPGVIVMAAESGVPIVPVTLRSDRHWVLSTWDRKIMPKPFSTIHITFHPPISVNEPNDQRAITRLEEDMS